MNCPECSRLLKAGAKNCRCGWDVADEEGVKPIKRATCYGCRKDLPWPSHKQEKAPHRIIGRTRGNQPICNHCYDNSPEFDWRSKAAQDFAEAHRDNEWGMLLKAAYGLKGAPQEDKAEFMGYLKEIARKKGWLKSLPYDPTKREAA